MSSMAKGFIDGLQNVFNNLLNKRNAQNQNEFYGSRISMEQLRQVYRTGIGNKIVRIKTGAALNDTIQFASVDDKEYYKAKIDAKVKKAAKWMLVFGRGIITIHQPGEDPSTPMRKVDKNRVKLSVFSGDMVSAIDVDLNLDSERYYRPKYYVVRGQMFHWTRVIDFTYVEPPELDAPTYFYGGVSEFELIYAQLINDGIIERASATIIEKASSFIYKVSGFKDTLLQKKDQAIIDYFGKVEDMRSIYGAVLIDTEDDATAVSQALTNVAEISEGSLRRLAMVTGIPLPWLVGENVKGMNAVGENERQIFQETIEGLESDYLLDPINMLMHRLGMGAIEFKENQGQTPTDRVLFDTKAIDNALKLWQMGEDHKKYLEDKGVIEVDDWDSFFGKDDEPENSEAEQLIGLLSGGEDEETNQQA